MKYFLLFWAGFLCIATLQVSGQSVIPDTLFGLNSQLEINPGFGDVGSSIIRQSDGMIIYGGYDYDISQNDFHIDMVRFDACGHIDSSFGTNGIVRKTFDQRNIGYAFTLQPDGKILCAGMQASSNAGSAQIPFISRFNTDGTPDVTFNGTGDKTQRFDAVSSGSFYSLYLMSDLRIVCIGTCSGNANGGANGAGVIRFMPDGTLDNTFNNNGIAQYTGAPFTAFNEIHGHLLQDGKIIITASTWDGSFIDHFFALEFDSTGVMDTLFGISGFFNDDVQLNTYSYGMASALQADDKVIMVANRINGSGIEVIRIKPDGAIDPAFGTNGHTTITTTGMISTGVVVLNNGQIMIMGSYSYGFGVGCGVLLNSDGSPDANFGPDGFMVFNLNDNRGTHSLNTLLELSTGHLLAGGSSDNFLVSKYTDVSNVPHISRNGTQLVSTGTGTFQWYVDGNLIPGGTSNPYQPVQNGVYTVMITDISGCTFMSPESLTVNNAGVGEVNKAWVKIYPNPFNDNLNVELNNTMPFEIRIFDGYGRLVMQGSYKGMVVLNTSKLEKGIYFYEIQNNTGEISKGKVIAD